MKREASKWAALAAMLVLLLSGCGSNRDTDGTAAGTPGGDGTTPLAAETVGLNVCTNCHAGQTNQWMAGPHANKEAIDHATYAPLDLGLESDGFPYIGYYGAGTAGSSCNVCHDQLGDSKRLTPTLTGNVERLVIGCESCHGGGQLHYGIGPLPNARPGVDQCGQCHNESFGHNKQHPEGDNIVEDVKASPHNSGNGYAYVMGDDGTVNPRCSRCHTDEGAKLYKNISATLGHDDLVTAFEGKENLAGANPIQCRTCHDAHNPDELLFEASGAESAEYLTCTNCHQVKDSYHGENNKYSWSGDEVGAGEFDGSKVIYDTHFDDPATADIEGYNLDPSNERVCRDCHNVHSADLTINEQWARSAHGGHLLEVKEADGADPFTAAVTEPVGGTNPFVTYDLKDPAAAYDSAPTCQRCHTSTGAKNYFKSFAPLTDSDPDNDGDYVAYNPANNDFSYLIDEQREMLYCATCHTDNAGGVHNTGAFSTAVDSTYKDAKGEDIVFADVGNSNACIPCHAGRQNGQFIKDNFVTIMNDSNPFNDNFGAFNSHYLTAAGILYNKIGYEFDADADSTTDDYANGYFKHDTIGTVDVEGNEVVPGTGTGGPCVGCHMDGGNANHTLMALKDDDSGADLCAGCHSDRTAEGGGDYTLYPSVIEEERGGFENALLALSGLLEAKKGIYVGSGYPYALDSNGAGFTAWVSEQDLGATFNLVMLEHEPGAYAHNRKYAKRLIFDSIDWVDNDVLDGAIDLSDPAYAEAAAWLANYSGDPASAITRAGL